MNSNIEIVNFRVVKNHPYLRALADLTMGGMHLRGLRLEQQDRDTLALGFPGRKIQGQWQVVYETDSPKTKQRLLECLTDELEKAA